LVAASLELVGDGKPVMVGLPLIVGLVIVGLVRVLFVSVFVFVVVTTSAIVRPCARVSLFACWLASV
jgi:hypothetical protein